MVIEKLKTLLRKFYKKSSFILLCEEGSIIENKGVSTEHFVGSIKIQENSKLILGRNVKFQANVNISGNSRVFIADDCIFQNVSFFIANNAEVHIGKGTVFSPPSNFKTVIEVNNGKLFLEGYNNIMSHLLVRFGGTMKIGKYTGIGYNSEIRCEESVTIGSYGLFSYDVCIYDTDTHSTNWKKRRERIEIGYPYGASEVEKPNTKPVVIGDDVWIGKGATITKGAQIGNRCIIGIRTVVPGGIYEDGVTIVSDKPRILLRKNYE